MKSTPLPIIEISDLVMAAPDAAMPYVTDRLAVTTGDVVAVEADVPADGRYLLRLLATLDRPKQGRYRFRGDPVDLANYRQCLGIKRQIGYVAADATMISNRTIRENLLLMRFYYENDLSIDIDEPMAGLCRHVGLADNLNRRPSELSSSEVLKAVAIREMGKNPLLMLMDRPETFLAIDDEDVIFNHLKNMLQSGASMVFLSQHRKMAELANRRLSLSAGKIRWQDTTDPAP
jgi:putative ABC transport system ATP-binding protein